MNNDNNTSAVIDNASAGEAIFDTLLGTLPLGSIFFFITAGALQNGNTAGAIFGAIFGAVHVIGAFTKNPNA